MPHVVHPCPYRLKESLGLRSCGRGCIDEGRGLFHIEHCCGAGCCHRACCGKECGGKGCCGDGFCGEKCGGERCCG